MADFQPGGPVRGRGRGGVPSAGPAPSVPAPASAANNNANFEQQQQQPPQQQQQVVFQAPPQMQMQQPLGGFSGAPIVMHQQQPPPPQHDQQHMFQPPPPNRGGFQPRGGFQQGGAPAYAGAPQPQSQQQQGGAPAYAGAPQQQQQQQQGGAPAYGGPPPAGGGGTFGAGSGFNVDAKPYVREEKTDDELFKDHTAGIDFSKYESIEINVVPSDVPSAESFAAMNLHPMLLANVQRCNYVNPTPVQKSSIPVVIAGHDLMTSAQTGSGKTCAYLLPAINYVLLHAMRPMPSRTATPSALILAPTRELGVQIYDEGRKFTFMTGLRCVVVYGGSEPRHQIQELQRGCNLLVATPGRLGDMYKRGVISYAQIQFLVLDEADRMLDMGFEPQIREIVERSDMLPTGQRQTLMYSATFPKDIQQLARSFLSAGFYFCQVGRVGSTTDAITQTIIWCEEEEKLGRLVQVLNDFRDQLVLVFIEKKRDCDYLERQLYQWGFPVCAIHGDRAQRDREMALNMFKTGQRKVLLATDVAARGLDIPSVALVLQFSPPTNIEDYTHRIGRTGRAGNKGSAWCFFNENNRMLNDDLYDLLVESKQELPEFLTEPRRRPGGGMGGGGGYRGRGGRGGGALGFRGGRGGGFGGHHMQHHHHGQHHGGESLHGMGGGHGGHPPGMQHHHGHAGHHQHHHAGFGSGFEHHNRPAPHGHSHSHHASSRGRGHSSQ